MSDIAEEIKNNHNSLLDEIKDKTNRGFNIRFSGSINKDGYMDVIVEREYEGLNHQCYWPIGKSYFDGMTEERMNSYLSIIIDELSKRISLACLEQNTRKQDK